jgi:uncharacterized protein DUF4154
MPLLARRALILALFLGLLPAPAPAGTKVTHEYDLKAAFMFHFAQFVQWPQDALPERNTPLTIGILGEDPFGKSLDEIVANEAVGGHKLVVRRFQNVNQITSCHILFISPSEAGRMDQILQHLGRRSILTVGETKDFAVRSGIIGFVISEKRLRLAINLAAANAARLTISSKLLRQSQIVGAARVQE